jgi:hypothetical protein
VPCALLSLKSGTKKSASSASLTFSFLGLFLKMYCSPVSSTLLSLPLELLHEIAQYVVLDSDNQDNVSKQHSLLKAFKSYPRFDGSLYNLYEPDIRYHLENSTRNSSSLILFPSNLLIRRRGQLLFYVFTRILRVPTVTTTATRE